MKLNPILLLAFVLVLAIGVTPSAYALTDITGCQVITVADTYQLTGNLFVNAGTDPTVLTYGACLYSATNIPITIEGNGFLLDASNTSGTEVAIRFSNTNNDATINNIRVGDNWDFSIDAINNVNIDITNNDLDAPINLQHSGIANILNNDIDSSDLAILHESNGAEETYIDNNNLTCTNIVSGNGGCIDTAFYGTAITYSITNNLIENYAVPFGYAYYYDFAGGNILNYIFDNNYIYERLTAPSLVLFGGGTLSIDSNTWTNEGADGHSETCTNDGTGYCVEDYEVFSGVFDTNSISLTPVACTENWLCIVYDPSATCDINDTKTADCVGVVDTNACGTTYTGDYSEFPPQITSCDYCTPSPACLTYDTPVCLGNDTSTASCLVAHDFNGCFGTTGLPSDFVGVEDFDNQTGSCDYCTPSWECDGYGSATCLTDDTTTASCNSANDTNGCYAQTSLPADQYSGDYSEFANETGVCDYCTPSWSCDNYINSTCVIVNGTGSLYQTCNSVDDANSCFSQTALPSDNYVGDYSEYGITPLECSASQTQKTNYAMGVLMALLPLIFICGSCLVYLGLNFGRKDKLTNSAVKVTASVTGFIIVMLLIALI
jgi:hypothetical protein